MDDDRTRRGADVLLDVDYRHGAFELVLANIGPSPAFDVRVTFSRLLMGVGGRQEISALPIFERLAMLRPGNEIRIFLDSAAGVFRWRGSRVFTATVTWRDEHDGQQRAKFRHDLDAFRDLPEIVIEP